jgi:hypothetical protein
MTEKGIELGGKGVKKAFGKKGGVETTGTADTGETTEEHELGPEDYEVVTDESEALNAQEIDEDAENAPGPASSAAALPKKIAPDIQALLDKGTNISPAEQAQLVDYMHTEGQNLSPEDQLELIAAVLKPKKPIYSSSAQAKEAAALAIGETKYKDLNEAYTYFGEQNVKVTGKEILDDLVGTPGPKNAEVAALFPRLWEGLHNNEFLATLLADIWDKSRAIPPQRVEAEGYSPFTLAMLDMVKSIGGQTIVLTKGLSDAEFKAAVLDTGLFVIDKAFTGQQHSATIHLFHALAVERLLKQMRHAWGAADFIRALGELKGTAHAVLGNAVWAFLFDTLQDSFSLHRPETLAPRIKEAFYEFE